MKLKDRLQTIFQGKIDTELLEKLPAGYSVIGDIAIFHHVDESLSKYKELLGDIIIDIDSQINVVVEQLNTVTPHRKPIISHIAGEPRTSTVHREYKTEFQIDVAEITLSPGNKGERKRLIQEVEDNEILCDMFACIGNLSLPVVVNKPTVIAYGIEWNQVAFNFLETNVKANKVEKRYYPIYGDNRKKTPVNFATRVLMGYFDSDEEQLKCGLEAIKGEGWIHYHSLSPRDNLNQPKKYIDRIRKRLDYDIEIKNIRKIKKYSPKNYHLCTDLYVTK